MAAHPNFDLNEKLTLEEYLKLEEENHQKYEYHDGYVYAMSGGSIPHGFIGGNIYGEIRDKLRGRPCKPINNDIKLWLKNKNTYVYPDCMIVCGKLELSDNYKDAIINPVVIVEVLSKSTEGYDRGDKFKEYRQIPLLRHYVLISQDKPQIEIYSRQTNLQNDTSLWKITTLEGLDKILSLVLSSTQNREEKIEIALKDIYEDVEFEQK
jgi:Uma2 family endonuclease